MELARRPPASPREMFQRAGISYRVARRFSKEIYRTIEKARTEDPATLALPARDRIAPPSRETKARLERLRQWRSAKAEELQLSVGVIFPGTLLEILAASPPQDRAGLEGIPGMRRWRVRAFGEEIVALLNDDV
jgi:ribonuclease D